MHNQNRNTLDAACLVAYSDNSMTPAETVFETFGGIRPTARVLNLEPSTVFRWLKYRNSSGSVGRVPQKHFMRLLEEAERQSKHLTTEHLVFGRACNRTVVRDGRRVPERQSRNIASTPS